MKMRKKIIFPSLILGTLVLTGAYGAKMANAQGGWQNHDSLIQKLVEKFNLNQDEVEQVFEQQRQQNQQQMQERHEERLSDLVGQEKLTEEQKQKILAKMEEQRQQKQQNLQEWQNLTPQQKREKMQQHREEMENWAEENGIDVPMLGGFGKGMGMHRDGGFGMGNQNNQ